MPVKCCKQGDTDCQSANPNLPICKTTNNTTAIDLTTSLEINGDLSVNKKNFQPYLIPLTQQAAEKANQFLNQCNYIDKIIILESDKINKRHNGFFGSINSMLSN